MRLRIKLILSWIILFITLIALLIALVLWHEKKQPMEMPPTAAVETNTAPIAATTSSVPVNEPAHANTSPAQVVTNALSPPPRSKWEQLQPILATQNDQPIVFYGKVEDQFSNVVAGATVNFDVRIYNGYESTVKRGQVISDSDGQFTISGYKGEQLGLNVKKQGYVLVSMNGSGIYSHLWPESQRAHPDPNNPTMIKMWKLQGSEPLVGINQHYKLSYTGTPINFDLLTGKIVSTGGDIRITVNRPAGDISMRNKRDWGFEIEAVSGGLIESGGDEAVTYAAPDRGYQPSAILTASNNRHGIELIQQAFFVESRDGQIYSKLSVSFDINSAPDDLMNITFSGVANTNSSRNWEATAPQ
jgi:hypothetical protein